MAKVAIFVLCMFLVIVNSTDSLAQAVCQDPTAENKLVCVLPGLVGSPQNKIVPNQSGIASFLGDYAAGTVGLSSSVAAIGTALTSLRLASPASGIIFEFDRRLAVVKR